MYDCGVSDAGAPLSRSRGVPLSAIFLRGCGTGAGCRCCGAAGSAAFCRSIATMPSPLHPADSEAALPSQIASKGSVGTQVAQLSGNLPQYQTTIETKITRLRNATVDKITEKLSSFGHQPSGSAPRSEAPAPAPTGASAQGQQQEPVPVVVTQPAPSVL